jgi:hypothetical protein
MADLQAELSFYKNTNLVVRSQARKTRYKMTISELAFEITVMVATPRNG